MFSLGCSLHALPAHAQLSVAVVPLLEPIFAVEALPPKIIRTCRGECALALMNRGIQLPKELFG